MSVWTEEQFTSRAKELAKAHVGAKTPINDLVEKVAREAELTPDAIRTLGRFTNVAVFQEMFNQKSAAAEPDRMVEFEPGDPEAVILRVVKSAEIQAAAASTTKVSAELPELMRQEKCGVPPQEKQAGWVDAEEREAPKSLEIMRLRKIADELEVTSKTAAQRWDDAVASLSRQFRKAPGYGPNYDGFEKAALAEFGASVVVELGAIREDLRLPPLTVTSEKIAALAERHLHEHTPQLDLLKSASEARETYAILQTALQQTLYRLTR